MKVKIYVLVTAALAFVALFLGIQSFVANHDSSVPKASRGILDLSEHDFTKSGPVKLDGEWEFISGSLVDSSYFDKHPGAVSYVPVPSLWTKYVIDGQRVPLYDSASYRLKVKVKNKNQVLGIKTSNIRMSNSIYINDKLLGQSGVPRGDRSYVPHNTPYTGYFYTDDQTITITVHVANFDYASGGGILGSIYLGSEKGISSFREESLAYDWIMISSLITMGVYFLGFYLHLRRDVHLLFFSLFCFATALYSATHGEKIVHLLYPQFPYGLFERIQGYSTDLLGLFLLLYYNSSLKIFSNQKVVSLIVVLGTILMISLLLPIDIHSMFQHLHSMYLLIIFLYVIYIQIKAIRKEVTGAMYLVSGSLALIVYFIVGTLNLVENITMNILPPLLPFFYLLMLSLFMAHRFADTFRKNEELSNLLIKSDIFKDEFLVKTSHEFRTPLHGIITIVQSVLGHSPRETWTKDDSDKLTLVVGIANRLSNLVNDIVDLSKLKQGELQINLKKIDIYSVVYVVSEVFAYMVDKDVKIIHSIPPDLPNVKADENRLRQILYNLIDNAVKHTVSGTIEVVARKDDNLIVISIKDTGNGIDPDQLPIIFEPFQHRQYSHKNMNGAGLGLNITQQHEC